MNIIGQVSQAFQGTWALNIEIWCHTFGFASLLITMIISWIEFNFQPLKDFEITKNPILVQRNQENQARRSAPYSTYGIIISNFLITLMLGCRWVDSGHFPLSNLYESLIFLSWTITFLHLLIILNASSLKSYSSNEQIPELVNKTTTFEKEDKTENNNLSWIGIITTPSALILNGFASFSLPEEMRTSGPLVPALQSNWLMMHVTLMILSYAALLLGSLVAMIFLVVETNPNQKNKNISDNEKRPDAEKKTNEIVQSTLNFPVFIQTNENNYFNNVEGLSSNLNVNLTIELLDNISYRLIGLGFPLLTIGIISGAVWANEAWGSYWSWDPKETWALITWLLFAIYLHTRLSKGWQGKKPAIVATIGFFIIWICYLGVNLLGKGLHSYGFFN